MVNGFVFYASFFEALSELDGTTRLQLYDAICKYALQDQEPELRGVAKAMFALIKPQIDANKQRRESGTRGGRPKKETDGATITADNTEEDKSDALSGTTNGFENQKPMVYKNETDGYAGEKPKEKEKEKVKEKVKDKEKETTPLTPLQGGESVVEVVCGFDDNDVASEDITQNLSPDQQAALRECEEAYARIYHRMMPSQVSEEIITYLRAGFEVDVIKDALTATKDRGKGPQYFTGIMRNRAREGIKTKADLDASKNGNKAKVEPDYSDPTRYINMDLKGFREVSDDEFL